LIVFNFEKYLFARIDYVIYFSGVIDPGESKNLYTASRKLIRNAESTLVEIDANFKFNLFGNINRPFYCVFRADFEFGLEFLNERRSGPILIKLHFLIKLRGMNC